MTAWLLRRLAASVAIVFAVLTLTFILIHLAPGTPFRPSADDRTVSPEVIARLNRVYGLDRPLAVQYLKYIGNVARGEFGESFSQHRPVARALADAVPNTVLLGVAALAIEFALGIALGAYQAARARRRVDAALSHLTLFFYSVPTFWLGLALLLVFGQWLHWLPVGGVGDPVVHDSLPWAGRVLDTLRHLVLPAGTLGLVGAAGTARYQRAAMLEVIHQDYIRTARAKGLTERRVLLRHALRNAVLPIITLLGLSLPFLLTGAVLVETVFSWPGMGKLAADAIFARDYPVVTAAAILAAAMVAVSSVAADLLTAVADPRVRLGARDAA